jgi:sugar transferase (PEP-CTERM/EpsH1 system associated)
MTRQIRVVHLVNGLQVGGLEKVVYNLVRFRDSHRITPSVLCLNESGPLVDDFRALGISVECLAGAAMGRVRLFARLVRRLREIRPHVLHTHNPIPHYFGVAAALLARVPVVVHTKHGRNRPDVKRRVALNHLAARLSSCVVAVSNNAQQVARRTERVPPRKLRLIRNGVALPAFQVPQRDDAAVKRGIHVARLNVIKDQATLLRMVRLVVDAVPDFRLDIVGDGPEREALERLSAELRLEKHVCFLGERTDVNTLLGNAGLFVLSSLGEGLSLTLLEAMASGLPIVATEVGGNPEVVIDGKTGLLVPPRSPEKLASAVVTLIQNPALARAMGEKGRRRAEAEFDMRTVATKYESLYEKLLRDGGC